MYTALIIDDEPWARKVLISLCDWEKYRLKLIGQASNGDEGLVLLKQWQPDLLITDMRMPGTDGVKLLQEVKEASPLTKVIAVSGYTDYNYMQQAIKSKVVAYLLKPVNKQELDEAITASLMEINKGKKTYTTVLERFPSKAERNMYLVDVDHLYQSLLAKDEKWFQGILHKISSYTLRHEDPQLTLMVISKLKAALETCIAKSDWSMEDILPKGVPPVLTFQDLADLGRHIIKKMLTTSSPGSSLDTGKVVEYIQHHYRYPISLLTLAEEFHVSREYLSRKFKKTKGVTVNDYIKNLRMEKARDLLLKKDLPIKSIGEEIGYPDMPYFYRVFKKHYGMAPGAYRKHMVNIVQENELISSNDLGPF